MSSGRARSAAEVLLAVASSGFLLALYSRLEAPWLALAWVLLTPWLAAVDRASSLRAAVARGALMSVAFALAVFPWVAAAISRYTGASQVLTLSLLAGLAPLLQGQMMALAAARWWSRQRGCGLARTSLAGAGAYVACEWLFGKLLGDTLGHGLYPSLWMRQAADLAGAPGLTFLLVAANSCSLDLARLLWRRREGWRRRALPLLAALAAPVALLNGYGAWRCRQLAAADGAARVSAAIVQGNIADYQRLAIEMGTYAAARMILDNYFALSTTALRQPLDLLVWPETVYPTTFGAAKSEAGAELDRSILSFVAAADTPLIFGAYDVVDGREYNAAVFLERTDSGTRFETYRKAHLFPLTERVPAWLDSERLRAWLPWLGTWHAGRGGAVVPLRLADGRTLRVAPLICYDAVDSGLSLAAVRAGAEVIVTLSNDSWFAESGGARLHLVVAAFRSIETRRPQLRATNTGISAVIDRLGNSVATAGVGERTALVAAVIPERLATTLLLLWGDWFGPVALFLAGLLLSPVGARKFH